MTKSRGINRPKWRPTPEQLDELRRDFATTPTMALAERFGVHYHQVAKRAELLSLKKDESYLNGAGGRLDGIRGMSTRFQPGQVPWSKGKKLPGCRTASTFSKGNKPHNYRPIGSYRVASGYLQQKITETGYSPRDWVMVHRLKWVKAYGPIPDGYVVAFKKGRRTTVLEDITLDALELVSKIHVMRQNSVWNLPPELSSLVRLRGQLTKEIKKQTKEAA